MNFLYYFTSLKWLLAIQSNWKSSGVCPIMPASAKGSSKTVPLRIYLFIYYTQRKMIHYSEGTSLEFQRK